jgi:hypothetical protein
MWSLGSMWSPGQKRPNGAGTGTSPAPHRRSETCPAEQKERHPHWLPPPCGRPAEERGITSPTGCCTRHAFAALTRAGNHVVGSEMTPCCRGFRTPDGGWGLCRWVFCATRVGVENVGMDTTPRVAARRPQPGAVIRCPVGAWKPTPKGLRNRARGWHEVTTPGTDTASTPTPTRVAAHAARSRPTTNSTTKVVCLACVQFGFDAD